MIFYNRKNLKRLRDIKGLSLDELSREINVSIASLSNAENRKPISSKTWAILKEWINSDANRQIMRNENILLLNDQDCIRKENAINERIGYIHSILQARDLNIVAIHKRRKEMFIGKRDEYLFYCSCVIIVMVYLLLLKIF